MSPYTMSSLFNEDYYIWFRLGDSLDDFGLWVFEDYNDEFMVQKVFKFRREVVTSVHAE